VHELLNESLVEVIYRPRADRFEPFNNILLTHPAIVLVECAMAQVLLARGLRPDFLLGASLGEIAALIVAEVLPLEEAVRWIIKQAEIILYCLPPGALIVVLESADLIQQSPETFRGCEVAGYNFPKSFVIASPAAQIPAIHDLLKTRSINFMDLPVNYAFHSRWTDVATTPFKHLLRSVNFGSQKIPVISAELRGVRHSYSPDDLWRALRNPIDFAGTIKHLETNGPYQYIDAGPAGNMATAVKYNLPAASESKTFSIMTPFGRECGNLDRLIGMLQTPSPA
jgi:acyl transferase domain-containing protein